ncbi:hypothetical protein ARMGADRAFT_146713 [Armillaria gallica]|uniref:Uncharacterized protein n=1 Tax=Armillaria gallica TaxID=47427 RepID=A0A2H3DCV2_ARMGA|nr:hypothetical protein ARMGADRAFT_146713 [Armillaria gallica]
MQLELEAVEKASLRLSAEALQWLFSASPNLAVQSIVMESIGGLPMAALAEVEDVFRGSPSIVDVQVNLLSSVTEPCAVDGMPFPIQSISSGMERKFERLLRSGMFISRVKELWNFFNVPDQLGGNEFGATLITQIPKFCRSAPWNLHNPGMFLHNILSLETSAKFPPIVWANLIQLATDSWDPDLFNIDDQFPMLLCSAVTESSIVRTDIPEQQLFASPLVVDFEQAVEYFPEMVLEYMMCWLSRFDLLHDERLECRVLGASIHFMIDRLSRSAVGTHISGTLEMHFLSSMFGVTLEWIHTSRNLLSVWKIFESVIVQTPIFSQDPANSKYIGCSRLVLDCYSRIVQEHTLASYIHAPSSALQLLINNITTQWSTLITRLTSTRVSTALDFLEYCLRHHFRPAYDVFHQQRCLEFLARQGVSSWSASLLEAYVIGIIVAIHPSHNDPEGNGTILQAIDCLHEPENLFLVCSTLARYTHRYRWGEWVPEDVDIMTYLARIRPCDPAWGDCRQRLQALAEDENCFVGSEVEKTEIEERRCHMRAAIERLEVFFLNMLPQAIASVELVQLPPTFLSLDVAEESLASSATASSVSVRLRRSPATLASTATTD